MKMPEGWKLLKVNAEDCIDIQYSDAREVLDLMKEMAEALEECVTAECTGNHETEYEVLRKFKEWGGDIKSPDDFKDSYMGSDD